MVPAPAHRPHDPILPWVIAVVLSAVGFVELRLGGDAIGIVLVGAAFVLTVVAAMVIRHRHPDVPAPPARASVATPQVWNAPGAWTVGLPSGPPKERHERSRQRQRRAGPDANCRALLNRSVTATLGFERGDDRDSARVAIAGDRDHVRCRISEADSRGVDFRNQVVSLGAEVADEQAALWHITAIGVVTGVGRVPDPEGVVLTIEPVMVHCRRRSAG